MPVSPSTPAAPPDAAADHAVRQRINLTYLIRLRWGAVSGQTVAVLCAAYGFRLPLPLLSLLAVLLLTASSNACLTLYAPRLRRVPEAAVGGLLALDVLLLTALLYFTGGCTNPFCFLYLIHIALASLTLRPRWLWCVTTLAGACFAALFFSYMPLALERGGAGLPPHMQRLGLASAFALAAAFIVHFVQRISAALATQQAEVRAARELAARTERLTSLATLAAGAAHELATPLATIAVVARELERALDHPARAEARADAVLIRQQVERCRAVLAQMASDAGADAGEPLTRVGLRTLIEAAAQQLTPAQRARLRTAADLPEVAVMVPLRGSSQALRQVIKNAVEASGASAPVTVGAAVVGPLVHLRVDDAGHGMAPQVLARVSEPFFTTKAPGEGMGLGLFLTRTLLESVGGALELRSTPNAGTTAVLCLPRCEAS